MRDAAVILLLNSSVVFHASSLALTLPTPAFFPLDSDRRVVLVSAPLFGNHYER